MLESWSKKLEALSAIMRFKGKLAVVSATKLQPDARYLILEAL